MSMTLYCPQCPEAVEVSEEDPDGSLSDLWSHLGTHTHDERLRTELFTRAQQDAAGEPGWEEPRVLRDVKLQYLSLDLWPGPYGSVPEARGS